MRRVLRIAVSLRTSVVLMLLIAVLLLATVVVPQRAVFGSEATSAAAATGVGRFLIGVLGLDAIATSPLFLFVLLLFYLNLVAVMLVRLPRTLARLRVQPPSPAALEKWIASPRAVEGSARVALSPAAVVANLRGFGFRPYGVTSSAMYAVKHRSAAVGFLLFHGSFLFLCAGGVLIWYTRFVGEMRVVEGQTADVKNARIVRRAPAGEPPPLAFTIEKMTTSFEKGEATDLRASIRFDDAAPVDAWVNHPAGRGPVSLLVSDIGLAPVFWLQDRRGFGIDRVAAPADRSSAIDVPLAAGVVRVRVLPAPRNSTFPLRESLASVPLDVVVFEGEREVFRGILRPGEAATLAGGRVVLTEVRYWGGIRIVRERGGALLILGFALATIGATWRLLMHRRDLVIAWSGASFRIAGHGEWFADRDRRELMELAAAFEKTGDVAIEEAVHA